MFCFTGGGQVREAHTSHDSGCAVGTQVVSIEKVSVCTARRHWSSFIHVQRWKV